jgi:hypothetical protein
VGISTGNTGEQVMAHLLGTRAVACLSVVVEFDTNLNGCEQLPSLVREAVMHELGGEIKASVWFDADRGLSHEGSSEFEDAQCIFYV